MTNYNPLSNQYITLSNTMTRNGMKNIRLVLDVDNNVFYTLDDDSNFKAMEFQPPTLSFYLEGNTSGTTILTANTFVNFVSNVVPTIQYQSQLNNGLSFNTSTGKVEYSGETRYFMFIGHIELSAGNNNEVDIALFKNGVRVPGSTSRVITTSGGKTSSLPGMGIVQLSSGDTCDIRVNNTTATTSIIVKSLNVLIKGI